MWGRPSQSRGQAYSLEGIIAALIVAGAVLVGLQAVDTTPWTTNGNDRPGELQQAQAEDLLAAAADDGSLSRVVRCVSDTGMPYTNLAADPPLNLTDFGYMLNQTFAKRGFQYRVSLVHAHWNDSTDSRYRNVTDLSGERTDPAGPAVTASRTVTLTDDMQVYRNLDGCRDSRGTLSSVSKFYADDVDSSSPVYNVVQVRLVVWQEGSG